METIKSEAVPAKVIVKIKDGDTAIRQDFLVYDPFSMTYDDATLNFMVIETMTKHREPLTDPDITITVKLTWAKRPEGVTEEQ